MPHDLARNEADAPNRTQPSLLAFLSLLVMLTLLIAAVGGYAYGRLRDEQRLEIERTLTVIAEQKRQQIEHWLAQTRDDAQLFFSDQAFLVQRLADWEAGGRQDVTLLDLVRERIAEIKTVRGWSGLAVLDTRGEPIITLGQTNFAAHAQVVQEVLTHPRLLSLDLHTHPQGQVEYDMLTPLILPDGRLLGVADLSWLADRSLFPLITSWPVPTQTAETYLVRREGEEVHYLTPLRHEADAALRKRLPLATPHLAAALAVQGQEGILPQSRDYRGEPILAYATAIAGTPWQMIAEFDQREAQAGIREIARVTTLILVLILLLIYSVGYAWWRRIQEQARVAAREASARLESERRWKLALDAAGHGVLDWNITTGQVNYSPTWKRLLGYDEAEIGGTLDAWEQLVHPEDLARVQAAAQAHLAGETPGYESVHRLRCQDGTWKWILDRGTVLVRDAAGRPLRMIGTQTDITAQKQAEADLRASEERFRYVMDATSDGIWDWNLSTNEVYYSPGWARMLGYAPEELAAVLSTGIGLVLPEERDQVSVTTRRLLEDPGHYELEFRLRTKSGDYRWVLSRAKVVEWGGDGTPRRAVGTHVDITERKARELDLRRYQQTVENASDMLLFLDPDLRYCIVNPAFAALNGTTPDLIVGRRVEDVERPEVFAHIRPGLEAALRGENRRNIFRRTDAAGQLHWLEGNVIPFVQDGAVAGLVVCLHDLTELYEAQAALKAERESLEEQVRTRTAELRLQGERLNLAAEAGGIGIWEWDMQTGAIAWDRRLRRLYGLTDADGNPSYDTWMSWIAPADRAAIEASVAAVLRGEEELFRGTFRVSAPDGRPRDIASRGRLLREGAEPARMIGVNWDVTELKAAQEAAEQASRAKGEFLSHMSHELRTPMNSMLGLTQVLERTRLDPEQRDMVAQIRAAGRSLLHILNDILDLAKIEAGRLSLDTHPFALATLLTAVGDLLGPAARDKRLLFAIAPPPSLEGALLGDPLRLQQVLVNLIGNAIKFTDRGEVRVSITPLDSTPERLWLRFAVSDTGIGIDPETLAELFKPFTQADSGITRRFGGTGLGLSICKRLVELMGGEICAESRPGQGSTFWCDLPFAPTAEVPSGPPAAQPEATAAGPRLTGLCLLVVDDSAMNRDVVVRMLALEGARATLAGDGQEALDRLRAEPRAFDAVLMDVQMPVLDGLSAIRLIRADPVLSGLPLLALTAGVLPEQQEAARAAGADAVLAKPLELEQLVQGLRARLGAEVLARAATQAGPVSSAAARAEPGPVAGILEDFPAIAGIDRGRAALTTGQDPAFFLSLLTRFLSESGEAVAEIRAWLARGELETAILRVHSLRGNAGNLGALAIMATAAGIEEGLRRDGSADELALTRLAAQLAALADASGPWIMAAAAVAQTKPELFAVAPLDRERLAALRVALRDRNLAALDLFEEMEPALRLSWGVRETAAAGRAIGNLQFAEVLAQLDRLVQKNREFQEVVDDEPAAIEVPSNAPRGPGRYPPP